jgi:hypothetical protein
MRALLLLPALAATTVAASSDVSPCLGEYQLDPVSGQCDLAANGGDLDEPMASSRSCRPHEYLCPDLQTCVGTAADFAGCSTPRRLQRSPSKCSLVQSDWDCGGVQCDIVPGPANDFVVTNNQSGFLWHTGKAQMSGDGRVNVSYFKDNSNTPFTSRHGTFGSHCNEFSWNDGTVWNCDSNDDRCPTSPMLDVHIIAHTVGAVCP